jgi:pantoate--beta-alanine ligase
MITAHTVDALRQSIQRWRDAGKRIAFVPTMGNLHEGHLTLVRRARELAEQVIVSIFVNPLQFGAGEDFDKYPRTLQRDTELLAAEGVDWLFAPSVDVMYPRPPAEQTQVVVPGLSDILCGASRPGHFTGVATVVCKLFNQVRPDVALFGQKDYQQLMVIRRMVEDLAMRLRIMGIPTVREADGLAMSSRNGYLSEAERATAPVLYRVMSETAEMIQAGMKDYAGLEQRAEGQLAQAGFRLDYFAVRRQADLAEPGEGDREMVILAAAFLGTTRLIDNLEVLQA